MVKSVVKSLLNFFQNAGYRNASLSFSVLLTTYEVRQCNIYFFSDKWILLIIASYIIFTASIFINFISISCNGFLTLFIEFFLIYLNKILFIFTGRCVCGKQHFSPSESMIQHTVLCRD